MKTDEIDVLVKSFMDIRRSEDLVIDLTIYFVNNKEKTHLLKNAMDTVHTFVSNANYGVTVNKFTEGEHISIPMRGICSYSDVVTKFYEFLREYKKPISLHLFINEKNNEFGFGIVDYK